jgi:cysteinyl-tRNA synthetase
MSIKYLGEQFDIHAGGIDHIPIHHTNEIAQSEAATGKKPWVKYWLHNEFLVIDKGKMSKSAGGFLTLQKLVDSGYDPLDYRYFLLGGHYRSQLQFSWDSLDGAKNGRKSLMDKFAALAKKAGGKIEADDSTAKYIAAFDKAIEDDLNTPKALAELWGILRDSAVQPEAAIASLLDMDSVLGLGLQAFLENEPPPENEDEKQEIEAIIAKRSEAKKAKDFAMADKLRQELKERGIVLEDGPGGTSWRRM